MIRFNPDTWRDAILRPIAMAAPDAGVYVEIMAPDFRFVFILLLLCAWGFAAWRGRGRGTAVPLLLVFITLAFVPWLVTTGNGRYFFPILLLAGPVCIALIHPLRITRALKVTLAVLILGFQLFLVMDNNPWRWWGLAKWSDQGFFATAKSPLTSVPATYVTVSSISYSLLIPRFPESSRWINLTSQKGAMDRSPDGRRAQTFLSAATVLKGVFPSMPDQITAQGAPGEGLLTAINGILKGHALAINEAQACALLQSDGLASVASRQVVRGEEVNRAQTGFWICPLVRTPVRTAAAEPESDPTVRRVFEKLERACPRIFPPGASATLPIPNGALRSYADSDTKAYVLDDGTVMYKYLRALNPVDLGTVASVLDDRFTMDCNTIRGRSGLPWEREI